MLWKEITWLLLKSQSNFVLSVPSVMDTRNRISLQGGRVGRGLQLLNNFRVNMGAWEQEERNETRCSEASGRSLPPPTSHCPQQVRHLLSTWGRASQAQLAWAMRPLHTGASSLHPSVIPSSVKSLHPKRGRGERGGENGLSFLPSSVPHTSPQYTTFLPSP